MPSDFDWIDGSEDWEDYADYDLDDEDESGNL